MLLKHRHKLPLYRQFLICLCGYLFGLTIILFNDTVTEKFKRHAEYQEKEFYTSDEIQTSNLLAIGIMTASSYVDNRAFTVWQTWAQHIPGKLWFFLAETTPYCKNEEMMPLVRLKGVDDVYPPQKKSFAMLRYIADDDLYVQPDKLEHFLRSLDHNKAHMIGQAGLGNTAEYGQLALGEKDNYCVIFSREALRILGPYLEKCLSELLTGHEDVELGRCVRKHVGIACTWNYEMQILFHNNQTGIPSFKREPSNVLFHKIITLHPVKQPSMMRKIHLNSLSLKLNELRETNILLIKELRTVIKSRNSASILNNENPLIRRITNTTNDIQHWNFLSQNKIEFCANQYNCPRHTINLAMMSSINQIVYKIFNKFNQNARYRGRLLQFENIQYGYVRLEPRHGVDYILDIVLWYKKFRGPSRSTLSVRRHAYIQQTFGPVQSIKNEHYLQRRRLGSSYWKNTQNASLKLRPIIYIIVALKGRFEIFQRFATNLRNILPNFENTNDPNVDSSTIKLVEELSQELPLEIIRMGDRVFNRGEALTYGVSVTPQSPNTLLFFTDVDMLFNYETLERIRLNTILGVQAYFPIVFSEYDPDYSTISLNNNEWEKAKGYSARRGYFRHFGFGIVAIYREDFETIGGFNRTIHGWGMEDVDFFERCVQSSQIRVFRAPEPTLIHVFHTIKCDEVGKNGAQMSQAQMKMCDGTKAQNTASQDYLAEQILSVFQQ